MNVLYSYAGRVNRATNSVHNAALHPMPSIYERLLKLSQQALHHVHRGGEVVEDKQVGGTLADVGEGLGRGEKNESLLQDRGVDGAGDRSHLLNKSLDGGSEEGRGKDGLGKGKHGSVSRVRRRSEDGLESALRRHEKSLDRWVKLLGRNKGKKVGKKASNVCET